MIRCGALAEPAAGRRAGTEAPPDGSAPRPHHREAFSYHRYELPLIGVFATLAAIELVVVHVLVSIWNGTAAWILSAATLAALAYIAGLIGAMIGRPILVCGDRLVIRCRLRRELVVPVVNVAAVEDVALSPEPKGAGVLRATVLAHPNIALRLDPALVCRRFGRPRAIETIALRIDRPEAFRKAVEASRGLRDLRLLSDGPGRG